MRQISRRALLGAGAVATVGVMAPYAATAAGRTTIVVSPHPDDEISRMGAYTTIADDRGDRLILVAVTDGGATGMGPRDGLSRAAVEERRAAEQTGAWSALTRGRGEMIRLGLPDGGIRYADLQPRIAGIVAQHPGAEVYVAAHPWDVQSDHLNTVAACRDSGAPIVRYAKRPDYSGGGTGVYRLQTARQRQACYSAVDAYWWTLGPTNVVASILKSMYDRDFWTRVNR